ncbi:MAG: HEAT repeat domain-containing protein [Candidatus Tectomicrobia bacterium]|uniref:HEAT repeat domain-containing protein n=1 Tax=Tectimicrobiota bacterium TaxID=2528274 RepID=A0A932GRF1_UNCTE|nr:HEAT repeat domain-containing protein [Candidatus Tectomicrobia bacterium]
MSRYVIGCCLFLAISFAGCESQADTIAREIGNLGHTDAAVRAQAAKYLGSVKATQAIPALIRALNDRAEVEMRGPVKLLRGGYPKVYVQNVVAIALYDIGPTTVEPLFAELQRSRSSWLKRGIILSLCYIINKPCHDTRIRSLILDSVRSQNSDVRVVSANRLGAAWLGAQSSQERESIINTLKSALTDSDWYVRSHAVESAEIIGSSDAVSLLKTRLSDEQDSVVKSKIESSLKKLQKK